MDTLTTFGDRSEFARAVALLARLGAAHSVVSPDPAYSAVASPALLLTAEARAAFMESGGVDIVTAGWVDYRPAADGVPETAPRAFAEDIVGRVAIVVLATCRCDPRVNCLAGREQSSGRRPVDRMRHTQADYRHERSTNHPSQPVATAFFIPANAVQTAPEGGCWGRLDKPE